MEEKCPGMHTARRKAKTTARESEREIPNNSVKRKILLKQGQNEKKHERRGKRKQATRQSEKARNSIHNEVRWSMERHLGWA